jgi:hypothetical protein
VVWVVAACKLRGSRNHGHLGWRNNSASKKMWKLCNDALEFSRLDLIENQVISNFCILIRRRVSSQFLESFSSLNWRPHLVAAVALSVLGNNREAFAKLCSAFDAGTWVTPQLAVVAYLRDPDFSEPARERVQAGCPVDASRLAPSSPLERHVAFGPAGAPERSAKAASALIYLRTLGGPSEWLTTGPASPNLVTPLSADRDNASSIAAAWPGSLKTILGSLATKTETPLLTRRTH